MLADFVRIVLKNLSLRGVRSWLTMIGIFIGIATIVALLSLGQGMKDAIGGQFASLGTDTITISAAGGNLGPPGSYVSLPITTDDLRVVKRVRGIDGAFGRLIESSYIESGGNRKFGYLVSLPNDAEELKLARTIPTKLKVEMGRFLSDKDTFKIMVGSNIVKKNVLDKVWKVGDRVKIEDYSFEVVGLMEKSGNPQLDNIIWAPEDTVRRILNIDKKYSLIAAKIGKGEDVNMVVERVEKALRKSRGVKLGKEDFSVKSSQELLDSLNSVLGAVQWFLIGIASISLLVGGVGIMNTMYTSVMERTREVGIMKAIGGRNSSILTLFLIESGFLGLAGGAIGVFLGMGLAYAVQLGATQALGSELIKAHFSFMLIAGSLMFSFLVGSFFGILPAWQAASMHPVEALRHG